MRFLSPSKKVVSLQELALKCKEACQGKHSSCYAKLMSLTFEY